MAERKAPPCWLCRETTAEFSITFHDERPAIPELELDSSRWVVPLCRACTFRTAPLFMAKFTLTNNL